jgi:hypothetical protein
MTETNTDDAISTDETVEQKYTRLHEKMDKTARSRFFAARRFELHEHLSLYTVVLISCCVIGLTLFDGLGMLEPGAEKLSAFLQVFCAVGVLVYSVILSKSDFALHAYRHHERGMELNKLKNAVYKHIVDEPKSDQFAKSAEQYAAILEKYEYHQNIDFQLIQCRTKEYHAYYGVNWWFKLIVLLKSTIGYWHYVIFSLLSIAGLITVFCKYGT